jgi:hypothetical protein
VLEKANPKSNRWVVDWADLKEVGLTALNSPDNLSKYVNRAGNRNVILKYAAVSDPNWTGYTKGQFERWLAHGYETSAIHGLSEFIPPIRDKRKFVFAEEGDEFHFDIAASGGDNFMSHFTTREQIPGLSLDIGIGFRAGVSAEILNAYLIWICRVAFSIESAGIDLEITLRNNSENVFRQTYGARYSTVIRVKKENEVSDFLSWSAMLSPAGFRGLVFFAKALHADSRGYDVSTGMGSSIGSPWKVEFNPEDRRMVFDCPHKPYSFPEADMQSQLLAQLKLASTLRK